jgi:hypothetical protein
MDTNKYLYGVQGFGAGVNVFLPADFYLSTTLALMIGSSKEDKEFDSLTLRSDPGLGVSAMFGKEWRVSPAWALGLAAQLLVGGWVNDEDDKTDLVVPTGGAVMLSASYD